eukprot:1158686-Pelagomonas_calceolata.AAC.7
MCLGPFKQPFWGFKGDVFKEAAQKGRVFEELVTDLSNVVSQQKLHIQVRSSWGCPVSINPVES